ncbi:MAG: imidazole glycerol phosphate synthase, glutamine amidotransferase subunit [Candidatus Staskawiczbacteria bacterium RIFCSPHIGHO2_02_FULL_34_10]|uniref:Imidazole glycerol phosphate synthase subunit HisH n=2 Tax=Candidatus Staskawicziibacteriota TaxID=1817916 RepID=A0A1G2HK68_9BACT|nr:MAG: imidazole glycerol phosphate synthase, glutamine amidotransferase subunit [Candidatus Staskawiczbacteria bacterium RIFCSPHIGHO2_01_FULL_34_27]OGZ66727.1 MAG: imidazole glycerol phosphate synthase, glutamine amidotransferase subunit [Candidatus Staskawiczbacteria bacterium RIFCSPHIGHO2_02_FULL_34_10]
MIAIIDYGLGNLTSVKNALDFLGIESQITNDIQKIQKADKIILPGVGAFGYGMENLKKLDLIEVLNKEVIENKKPFLGICLGMQLICKKSYEEGVFEGLGWIDAQVVRFSLEGEKLLVPHVGWNEVRCNLSSPILTGGNKEQTFYFVHSYYVDIKDKSVVVGWCDYGSSFPAIIQKENIFAVQFHPEKSQTEGLEILRKFSTL